MFARHASSTYTVSDNSGKINTASGKINNNYHYSNLNPFEAEQGRIYNGIVTKRTQYEQIKDQFRRNMLLWVDETVSQVDKSQRTDHYSKLIDGTYRVFHNFILYPQNSNHLISI